MLQHPIFEPDLHDPKAREHHNLHSARSHESPIHPDRSLGMLNLHLDHAHLQQQLLQRRWQRLAGTGASVFQVAVQVRCRGDAIPQDPVGQRQVEQDRGRLAMAIGLLEGSNRKPRLVFPKKPGASLDQLLGLGLVIFVTRLRPGIGVHTQAPKQVEHDNQTNGVGDFPQVHSIPITQSAAVRRLGGRRLRQTRRSVTVLLISAEGETTSVSDR